MFKLLDVNEEYRDWLDGLKKGDDVYYLNGFKKVFTKVRMVDKSCILTEDEASFDIRDGGYWSYTLNKRLRLSEATKWELRRELADKVEDLWIEFKDDILYEDNLSMEELETLHQLFRKGAGIK